MSAFLRRLGQSTCFSLSALYGIAQTITPTTPDKSFHNQQVVHMLQLPLAFEENAGQVSGGADYVAHSGAMQAAISGSGMRLLLPSVDGREQQLSIRLNDVQNSARPVATGRLLSESNYLLGSDASLWRTHVPQFERVTYPEVYRSIDLTYYGNGSHVEHDFILHPGADPSLIQLQFDGARNLEVTRAGDLRIALDRSAVTLRRPDAYQTIGGARRRVPAKFVLAHKGISFRLGNYDRSQPLVIDPILDYSTFLGDASIYVQGLAVDASGNTYITGEATVAYPATANSNGCSNCTTGANKLAVFVTKMNATGTAVIYSTFIGGSVDPNNNSSNDMAAALTVDTNENAIVIGSTSSTDFPSKNPITAGSPGFFDGFLLSLTPDGSSINFSSRLSASSPQAVTTDTARNVYVAGSGQSSSLPITPGALNAPTPHSYGAFLLKLTSVGALSYGAIVGEIGSASGTTGPSSIAVDTTGVVYMAGTVGRNLTTGLTPWPTTSGAYQSSLLSPSENAPFVARISADASTILSSTLVGSGSVASMALTSTHDVLIAGSANYNFPVTPDAYASNTSTSINGAITLGASAFFARVSEDGTQLLYSSMYGPSGGLVAVDGIGEDPNGNVWLAGTTTSGLSQLVHPLQSVFNYQFSGTGFVAEFDPPMHNLLFSSYVNSETGFSQVKGFAIDTNGLAHVAGIASQDFPTTENAVVRSVTPPPPNYTYNYGFAALIDASKPGPSICFANQLNNVSAQVGATGKGSFDIVNCGDGPLTISSAQLTSDVFAFASTNICTSTLAPGKSCTLAFTFTPEKAGAASALVLIKSNAPMAPNSEAISGTGTTPVVSLPFGTALAFSPQVLGSPVQSGSITIGNQGTAPLVVDTARTTITGPFSVSSTTCGSPLIPNSTCTYTIAFNSTTSGAASGTLTVYTNDTATPSVTFSLTGTILSVYPVPTITGLSIPTISLDGSPVDVTIFGTNFFPQSTVSVNGVIVAVKSSGDTAIIVTVDPHNLPAMGDYPVQVVNPAPGNGSNVVSLTAYRALKLTATNLVYEPSAKLLYAAIPATSADSPNTIVLVDPATGTMGTPIPVQTNPTRLALSDDGRYLYVGFYYTYSSSGMLQRIDLTKGAVDRTFTLPGSSDGIIDMHVVPGSPQLLVASLSRNASPVENGVALFNDAGLVQYISNDYVDNNYSLDSFTFTSDPTAYYGYPFNQSFFNTASVSVGGITPISYAPYASCCEQTSGSIIVSDGTLLYTNSGQVWDPKTKMLLGRYDDSLFYEAGISADPVAKRTFILEDDYQSPTGLSVRGVVSYDPSTFKPAGAIYFAVPSGAANLVRWGVDGFAFLASTSASGDFTNPGSTAELVIFRSSNLAMHPAAGTVTASSLSPASAAVGSPALTLTVDGSGFSTDSTVLWNGYVRATTFVNSGQLTAAIPATDLIAAGTAQVSVSDKGTMSAGVPFVIAVPAFRLSSQSLSFDKLPVGANAQQALTVQNSAPLPLTNITVAVSGQNSADFNAASNCGASLAAGASCTVTVTFTPSSIGDKSATMTVSVPGASSQTVSLMGTVVSPDFVLPAPTGSNSASVSAGQSASFTFSISQYGAFTGTVAMSCTNLPAHAACAFTPASFTIVSAPTPVTLQITTEQTVQASLQPLPKTSVWPEHLTALATLLLLPVLSRRARRRLRKAQSLFWLLVIGIAASMFSGCGGGSGNNNNQMTTVQKTPPGTYTVTVVATSGAISHSTDVTLTVQ